LGRAWQGIALLPFINSDRLLEAMATKYPELSDDERKRNEFGKGQQKHKIDPAKSRALHGDIEPHDLFVMDSQLVPPFDADGETDFEIIQDRSMR
jgi:5'-3' exoribonuclease 2